MNLRLQVLLAGSLTLVVPALGWQVVRQLDASLLEARVRAQELAAADLRAELLETGRAVRAEASDDGRAREPGGSAGGAAAGAKRRDAAEIAAVRVDAPPTIDGYADEWPVGARRVNLVPEAGRALAVRATADRARLYLMVEGDDAVPTWHRPPPIVPDAGELERPSDEARRANGDALELFLQTPDGRRRHALLSPLAPGELAALVASDGRGDAAPGRAGAPLSGWRAAWQLRTGGWRAELALPLPPAGTRIAFAAFDVEEALGASAPQEGVDGAASRRWRGTLAPTTMRSLRRDPSRALPAGVPGLYLPDAAARDVLAARVPAGVRVRLFDAAGRLLADVDRLNAGGDGGTSGDRGAGGSDGADDMGLWDALLFRAFAWTVAGDLPLPLERGPVREPLYLDETGGGFDAPGGTRRYVTPERDRVIGTLASVGTEQLLYESNEEHSAAYNGSRLARLFSLLVLASLVSTAVALGWAARLSLRIRALSRAAANAVDRDGRVAAPSLPDARAADEIGALSRDLQSLLRRSARYNAHLQSLAGRLSHELGTPLAVVRGSLEHLNSAALSAGDAALVERAADGAHELAGLLRALVDSTRLEGMLARGERVSLELGELALDCLERYRRAYPGLRLSLRTEPCESVCAGMRAVVVPEAIVQALDKLVDNAHRHGSDDTVELVIEPLGRRPADAPLGRIALPRPARRGRRRANVGAVLLGVTSRAAPGDAARVAARLDDAPAEPGARGGLGLRVVELVAALHGGRPVALVDGDRLTVGLMLPLSSTTPMSAPSAYDQGSRSGEAPA